MSDEAEYYREKRILDIREWGITRQVGCPTCGAPSGEDCHTEPGWYPIPDGHAQRRRDARMVCEAVIWHGPGHQSKTKCEERGRHTIHQATLFGEHTGIYEWEGGDVFAEYGGGTHPKESR